ncbi:hypothetical protein HPB47_002088 [Ixodes persulcatus]|uniref:Uncharacterized protein n=1 Tax=Ixodes persulcatus TaxID=34615 RepID=A0AC60PM71_IXOPE|nr:hypothetical protein HPB47_002088 [Ixodes persulcatus]
MEQMETLNKEVTLTLGEGMNATNIPHQLTVFGCRSLVLVPGRPPLCLRCNRIGHIRRECRIPRCGECRRYGHDASECVTTYADKLRQSRSVTEDVVQDHLMDISEVVDATGDIASSPIKTQRTESETSTQRPEEDAGPLLKLGARPVPLHRPSPRDGRRRRRHGVGAAMKTHSASMSGCFVISVKGRLIRRGRERRPSIRRQTKAAASRRGRLARLPLSPLDAAGRRRSIQDHRDGWSVWREMKPGVRASLLPGGSTRGTETNPEPRAARHCGMAWGIRAAGTPRPATDIGPA